MERSKREEQFPPVNAQCVCVCVRTTDPVVQRRLVHLDGRCGSGPENGPSRRRMPPWIPFFECLFSEIANEFFTKIIEKGADKKKNRQTSEEIWSISSSARTAFWTAKCQILVAKPLKRCPENEQRISLKRSTKEHLRLLLGRWHSPQVAPAAQLLHSY